MAKVKTSSKSKYVKAYGKQDQQKDELSFYQSMKNNKDIDWGAFKRLMIADLCANSGILNTGYIGDVKLEDIDFALKYPTNNWKTILRASEQLMRISPHYYRLNSLFSNMAMFCWGIDLYDTKEKANVDTIKKVYRSLATKLESMNLKHEFSKIMKYLPYQDIYCGLVVENETDFFFQKISLDICKLYQIQDGLYNFKINLSSIDPKELTAYPDYVQEAYMDFYENKLDSFWYVPPADKQICVKFNSQWSYPYPVLIGLVKDILDLETYKKLKLQSARTDNYKAILIKVPIDETTIDKPLLTPASLGVFAEMNRENLNDDIGILHTLGSNAEAISFKDTNNTTNNVSDAVDEIYNASGITQEAFNGSSSGTAVKYSMENDAGYVYSVYKQLERWMNRFIKLRKYNKNAFKFHFYLLDITIFNKEEISKHYKEACTLGIPVVDKFLATLDMSPSRVLGSYIIHNEVFDFYNKFKPLTSSYNTSESSATGEVGRPTAESKGEQLSDSGEDTRDNEKNDR